jgi:hypothetical protein
MAVYNAISVQLITMLWVEISVARLPGIMSWVEQDIILHNYLNN